LAKDDELVTYGEKEVLEALNIGAVKYLIVAEDHEKIDTILKLAEEKNIEVYVVNNEIPEYEWLKKTFNGLVAVLRYQLS
ncbi:MAG: ribosomal L7Ae/L30e/S12e/Gadd45 family protein, partial [Zestosphaera sp.]